MMKVYKTVSVRRLVENKNIVTDNVTNKILVTDNVT